MENKGGLENRRGFETDTWQEYRHYIIIELNRLNDCILKQEKKSEDNLIEISKLRVWSVVYGSIGGGLMAIIVKGIMDKW